VRLIIPLVIQSCSISEGCGSLTCGNCRSFGVTFTSFPTMFKDDFAVTLTYVSIILFLITFTRTFLNDEIYFIANYMQFVF
jgi:hypothetical protein